MISTFDSGRPGRDDRTRLLALLGVLIVCVALPVSRHASLAANGALIVVLALVWRVSIRAYIRRLLPAVPIFAAVSIWLPFVQPAAPETPWTWCGLDVYPSGVQAAIGIALKTATATGTVVLSSVAVTPDRLWSCLAWMRVPPALVTGLIVTTRSIHILVEQVRKMRRALLARGYRGRNFREIPHIGRMIGALFVRSHERQERVHAAMRARGFDGHVRPAPFAGALAPADWLRAGTVVAISAALGFAV